MKSKGVPLRLQYRVKMNDIKQTTNRNNRKPNAKEIDFKGLVVFLSQRHKDGRLNKACFTCRPAPE